MTDSKGLHRLENSSQSSPESTDSVDAEMVRTLSAVRVPVLPREGDTRLSLAQATRFITEKLKALATTSGIAEPGEPELIRQAERMLASLIESEPTKLAPDGCPQDELGNQKDSDRERIAAIDPSREVYLSSLVTPPSESWIAVRHRKARSSPRYWNHVRVSGRALNDLLSPAVVRPQLPQDETGPPGPAGLRGDPVPARPVEEPGAEKQLGAHSLDDRGTQSSACDGAGRHGAINQAARATSKRVSPGLNYAAPDKPLLLEMRDRIRTGEVKNPWNAALAVADRAKGAGNLDTKMKRLAKKYRQLFPND